MHYVKVVIVFTVFCSLSNAQQVETDENVFPEVMKSAAFVDKTLLLKRILNNRRTIVTAPRRFFKSTNLNMLKSFLSINETGAGQEENKTERVNIFKNMNIYEKERQFFDQHFGKYPVIYLDLNVDEPIRNFDEALEIFATKLHNSFRDHAFLSDSYKLKFNFRKRINLWNDKCLYGNLSKRQVKTGLQDLAEFLFIYYNTKVFVLVDGYDSLIYRAMFSVLSNVEFNDIVQLVLGQITGILNLNNFVSGGVVTGVSAIAGSGFTDINNAAMFRFLHGHPLKEFYGFSEAEVETLFSKSVFNLSQDKIKEAKSLYDGYKCIEGTKVYSPFSILNFLKYGQVVSYWKQSDYIYRFEILLKHPPFYDQFQMLIRRNTILITHQRNIEREHLLKLRTAFFVVSDKTNLDCDLVFSHLLDLGYLSFAKKGHENNWVSVKIPNREIWRYFYEKLLDYYVTDHKVERQWFYKVNYDNINEWYEKYYNYLRHGWDFATIASKIHTFYFN